MRFALGVLQHDGEARDAEDSKAESTRLAPMIHPGFFGMLFLPDALVLPFDNTLACLPRDLLEHTFLGGE